MTYNAIKTTESANTADPDVAVDRISSKDYQLIKVQWGPEGTANDTDDASGKRFPVNIAESALITATNTKLDTLEVSVDAVATAIGTTNTKIDTLDGSVDAVATAVSTMSGKLPTALGSQAAATSLGAALSTEDIARIGATNETAAASDTATAGLNGRLQRIAQRITSLIALLPTALTTIGSALKTGASEGNLTCTVTSGQTASAAIDTAGLRNAGLYSPAAFDGTTITFQVSHDASTYQALYDILNTQVSMTIAASRNYDLPGELMAWRYWKIVCGTSQTGDTAFVVVGRT